MNSAIPPRAVEDGAARPGVLLDASC